MNDQITKVGVTALIYDIDGKFLLGFKNRAFSPEFANLWVTPGGRVNYGERLTDAIKREAQEETGLEIVITDHLRPEEIIHGDGHFVFFVFEAFAESGIARPGDDLSELRWLTCKQAVPLLPEMTPLTQRVVKRVI